MQKRTNDNLTIHTSRTMMYNELTSLINQGIFNGAGILEINTLNKSTKGNLVKTLTFLSQLYDFKSQNELWKTFLYLWNLADESNRRLMTLLYALEKDYLLRLSVPVVTKTPLGEKLLISKISDVIKNSFPERYTPKTLHSIAKNIASSWKQAGFIQGKVKSIRVVVNPGYISILFALYLGKLDGLYGEELLKTFWIELLNLSESELKEKLHQAILNDLISFKQGGGITTISFDKLLKHIEQ